MTFGERLKEERTRLGLSQPAFAGIAATTKQTLFSWESCRTAPDAPQLAALAAAGVDVLYVVTGQRMPVIDALEVAEHLLLESYRKCTPEARAELTRKAVLLAAGLSDGGTQGGGQHNTGAGAVQVGSGTNVTVNAPVFGGGVAGRDNYRGDGIPGRTKK